LVGHVYSLVPIAVADNRLAWQIIACYHDSGVIDALPSVCASKAMVHCICTCHTQTLVYGIVFVALLPTGRSQDIKKSSSRSQSKTN